MKATLSVLLLLLVVSLPVIALADPVAGLYTSTDMGGQLLTGRAATWRSGINSGFPHVLHAQSWDGAALGTQWEISCPTSSSMSVQDNRISGVGTIVYTSTYSGGTFSFFAGGHPWGDGTGTLSTMTVITTVQYVLIGGVSTPVAAVVNGNTSGTFANGCTLVFAIGNGVGAGETTSLNPAITKPAGYPTFLDGSCGAAPAGQQYGTWGSVITLTLQIDCAVANEAGSWSSIKATYR